MKKTIFSSLILGILVFFAIAGFLNFYFRPLIENSTQKIGYWGSYTVQNMPESVLGDVSYGLTKVSDTGSIQPAAAERWTIKDNKTYTFYLRKGLYFHSGEELTSENIGYNFENVISKVIDKYTIEYSLKDPYAPFLAAVSRPIISKDLSGIGDYQVEDIELNGGLIRTIVLQQKDDKKLKKKISVYPTQKALKVALMLGEIDSAHDISNLETEEKNLKNWKNINVEENTDYDNLVSIFYNYNDPIVGNKKLRQALNYSLPSDVKLGERAYSPIPPKSIYFDQGPNFGISDLELASTILETANAELEKPLVISTTEEYQEAAKIVVNSWGKLGIKSEIRIIREVPGDFQILLYSFKVPKDPDQYVLWHSGQPNNIVGYKNLRIDKLLEDGRSITDPEERKKIYADFQKYLIDDVPASFFYFPKEYVVTKN